VGTRQIKEIEEMMAAFEIESQKQSGANIKEMMEMICKISILLGSLGHRYHKKEMENLFKHLDINVKKRVKTFEGGRFWTYVSVGIQLAGATFSFAGVGGSFGNQSSIVTKALTGLGQTSTAVSNLGSVTTKLGDIDGEKKAAIRTEEDHIGEKIKQIRGDVDRTDEKTNQAIQQHFSMLSEIARNHSESVKRAAN
jgi:hypothetical protein